MDENEIKSGFFANTLKSVGLAVIITLISVLIFGIIVKFAMLNNGVIKAVNQFIKVLSIFIGCFFFIREKAGLIKGCLAGLLTTLVVYLIFGLIGGQLNFDISFVFDLVFGAVVGAISGIIAVNVKKEH